jgi:ornithine decarboxylase
MGLSKTIWTNPTEYLRTVTPQNPVLFFSPQALQRQARRFMDGFPGMVTYAVKSNPEEAVIENLVAAGLRGFDVASPFEMHLIRRFAPDAAMHYNNPVRARSRDCRGGRSGCAVLFGGQRVGTGKADRDGAGEGTEITVRFKLPVSGAAYNFGAKFGATAELATVAAPWPRRGSSRR